MEKRKLHRVVGILILIAVIVIILPLVTNKNDPANKTLSVEAPPFPANINDDVTNPNQPQSDTLTKPTSAEEPPAIVPPSATPPEETAAPAAATPTTPETIETTPAPEEIKKQPDTASIAPIEPSSKNAWAIQMGNFHNHANAIRLTNRLRAAGYQAFTREITSSSGRVNTRVYVGPKLEHASAKALSGTLNKQFKIEGLVVPFASLSL